MQRREYLVLRLHGELHLAVFALRVAGVIPHVFHREVTNTNGVTPRLSA